MAVRPIMIVAGEASGDQHAADLVRKLRAADPDLRFFGMGGPRLAAEGVELIHDAREVSVMGITEVLPKIPRILQVMRRLARTAERRQPVLAVLVDIPDFNLRLGRRLRQRGVPIVYYISPMVWAWRPGRVKLIRRLVDRMLCILPFEPDFYRQHGVPATYVGSPVLEQVPRPDAPRTFRESLGLDPTRPTVALLPGSRAAEIRRILPTMVEAAVVLQRERPDLQLVVPVATTVDASSVRTAFEKGGLTPLLVEGRAPEAVGASDVAVVASGTAVLEAGLMQRPLVVVYRVSRLTYWVGRLLLRVTHVALVNLLAGRRVVPELLQDAMTSTNIVAEVRRLWGGPDRVEMIAALAEVRARLGPTGAAQRAAEEVLTLLRGQRFPGREPGAMSSRS